MKKLNKVYLAAFLVVFVIVAFSVATATEKPTTTMSLSEVCEHVNATNVFDLLAYTDPTKSAEIDHSKPAEFIYQYATANPEFIPCMESYFGVSITN